MEEPIVNEVPVIEEPTVVPAVAETKPQPGDKTPSALLLESLHEERAKRKALEAELEEARQKIAQPANEVFSDEGKLLDTKIARLEAELKAEKEAKIMSTLHATYPILKDKSQEFEQYLADNPGMRREIAAKSFLVENDLLETPKVRKGLENASGGGRTPVPTGMTPEDIDNLRVNNFNEYARRIRAGTLK